MRGDSRHGNKDVRNLRLSQQREGGKKKKKARQTEQVSSAHPRVDADLKGSVATVISKDMIQPSLA